MIFPDHWLLRQKLMKFACCHQASGKSNQAYYNCQYRCYINKNQILSSYNSYTQEREYAHQSRSKPPLHR